MPATKLRKPLTAGWQPSGYSFQFSLIALATMAALFSRTSVSPLQEALKHNLVLTDTQIALIQGPGLALPAVLSAVPIGALVDRHSRASLVIALCSTSAVGCFLTALCSRFYMLLSARAAVGLCAYAIPISAFSLVADITPPERRGRANMALAIAEILGVSLAFLLGGRLLAAVTPPPAQWRQAMLWMSVPVALAAVATLWLREPGRSDLCAPQTQRRTSLGAAWHFRSLLVPLVAGAAMVGVADGATLVWAVPSLMRHYAIDAGTAGTVVAAATLAGGLLGPAIGGSLADACYKQGRRHCTLWALTSLALASTLSATFPLPKTETLSCVLLVAFLTLGASINVILFSIVTVSLPNDIRGMALSILAATALVFGLGLAPLSVTVISSHIAGALALPFSLATVCSGTSLLGAAAFATPALLSPPSPASHPTPQ